MQSTVIRAMALADLDRVVNMAAREPNAPGWPRSAYMAAIEADTVPRRIALVAEDDATSQIAGFVIARLMPPESELESIVTATEFRRRGVARQLFASLVEKLKEAGITEVLLELRESNRPARALYQSLGFAATGSRPAYYADPAEDAVLMRLVLDGSKKG
jgi:ribosomal-protein-alanine acetyltransferase